MSDRPRVHIVPAHGFMQCAVYLIVGPGGAVLVDVGSGAAEAEVLEGIRKVGVAPEQVHYALLTHCHVDHALGAWRFRDRGVKLVASPVTAEILRRGGSEVWVEFPDYIIPTEVDVTAADGERLTLDGIEILVLHTPGHTAGCTSYLVETTEGLTAFTGDLVFGNGQLGWQGTKGFSVEDTLASLEKLLAHRPDRAYTGHGAIAGSAAEWLQMAIALGRSGKWNLEFQFHTDLKPAAILPRRKT